MPCYERRDFMVKSYEMSRFDAMSAIMKDQNADRACRRSPQNENQLVRIGKRARVRGKKTMKFYVYGRTEYCKWNMKEEQWFRCDYLDQ